MEITFSVKSLILAFCLCFLPYLYLTIFAPDAYSSKTLWSLDFVSCVMGSKLTNNFQSYNLNMKLSDGKLQNTDIAGIKGT